MIRETSGNYRRKLRMAGLAIALLVVWGEKPAPAYWVAVGNGFPLGWTSTSPSTIWSNSTQTLFWSFNPIGFPQSGWPSVPQAGAAFQNAFQSIQDVSGTALNFVRNPNRIGTPKSGDGFLDACLTSNEVNDYFGQNITGESAVTYVTFNATSGSLVDADIEVNGDPSGAFATWSTAGPSAPAGSFDLESTAIRHAMTALGSSSTPFLPAAAWPLLRAPGDPLHDRCLSTDDRMFARTIAPAAPAFSTLTGTVTVAGSGVPCNLAIVIATDGDGVPQAVTVTQANGTYSLNIPSSTNDTPPVTTYSVTAQHFLNGTYVTPNPLDLSFTGATGFIAVQPPGPVDTRAIPASVDFTVTAGTPTLTLLEQSLAPAPTASQVIFLNPATSPSGTLQFLFQNSAAFPSVNNLSLGPGLALGTPALTAIGLSQTLLSVTYTLATTPTPAAPGLRNLSFSLPSGEQFFLPGVVEVMGLGSLSSAAGAQNPVSAGAMNNQAEVPLLQMTLTASAVEDVRIHQLQFSLSGQGATPAQVHLWNDRGTIPGFVDPSDVPIVTGNAFSQNPVGEMIVPSGPTATLTWDNLALTLPAGTSITFLLTADMPASGSGSYTATFDPSGAGSIIAQGMFWGDAITPAAGAVSGGLITLGSATISSLGQFNTADSSVIPVGGSTAATQITVEGTVSSPSGQVGMEVEVKPLGVAFDGTATQIQPPTASSGSVVSLVFTGLATGTAYHWRARGLSSTGLDSPWVSFGNNPESAADFLVDLSTVSVPSSLAQLTLSGAPVPIAGSSAGGVVLEALSGTDSLGYAVRVEFEVRPSTQPFTNVATSVGAFAAAGARGTTVFPGSSGTYQWQARTVSQFGAASSWVAFSGSPFDFTLVLPPITATTSKGGCIASLEARPESAWRIAWILALAAMVLLLPGRWKRTGGMVGALLLAGELARADQDPPLPRALIEVAPELEGSLPRNEGGPDLPEVPDSLQEDKPPPVTHWSLDAYAGPQFLNTRFNAIGTNRVHEELSGIGAPLVGVEGLYELNPSWRIGLGAQASLWRDVRVLSAGPVATYRFAHSEAVANSGRFRWEHFLRAQVSYESFVDTKPGFTNFSNTVGGALGYEFRYTLVRRYSLTFGADVEYAQWNAASGILSGNTKVGGFGAFFYVGIAFLP